MWCSLIENQDMVRAIYRDEIPLLNNIFMQDVKIINGEEVLCYLRFDLKTLPKPMPSKWSLKNVNTVQFDIALACAQVLSFNTHGGDCIGSLDMVLENDIKKVSFTVNKRNVFIIYSKWITIRSVTGYFQDGVS